jgi:hypothetical protein
MFYRQFRHYMALRKVVLIVAFHGMVLRAQAAFGMLVGG